jgi:hypothetical protein
LADGCGLLKIGERHVEPGYFFFYLLHLTGIDRSDGASLTLFDENVEASLEPGSGLAPAFDPLVARGLRL